VESAIPSPSMSSAIAVYFQLNAPTCYQNEMCVGGAPSPVTFDFRIDDLYFVNKTAGGE
jgi:hypothetical protein